MSDNEQKYSRRQFLRLSATAGTGALLAACGGGAPAAPAATTAPAAPAATTAPAATAAPAATSAPAGAGATTAPAATGEMVLDVVMDTPEYENQHRQIFDIFEQENPGVKINFTTHSEDAQAAYAAKVAGGYLPAMESIASVGNNFRINKDSYQNYVDLSTIDYPYWDLWTYDAKNAWSNLYEGLSGPRSLSPFLGWVVTWHYHEDLLEKAGLNPRRDVKTWDDLQKFLADGTQWAKSADSGVDFFWDQAWLDPWFGGPQIMDHIPLAFPDGQREQQIACWKGQAKFNGPDSPYRHTYEFFKSAYDQGWLPENFWPRSWETDMESSFAAKKSALMLHGPWPWDKTLAVDPNAKMSGFPSTPPAQGQGQWVQFQADPEIDKGNMAMTMRVGNEQRPEWDAIKKLFIWWHSPDTVRLRSEAIGFLPALKLDPPADMQGPQFLGIIKDIETPGGAYANVKFERSISGETQIGAYRVGGSPGVWEVESGNIAKTWADVMTGAISVKDALDKAQANYEASYKGVPQS